MPKDHKVEEDQVLYADNGAVPLVEDSAPLVEDSAPLVEDSAPLVEDSAPLVSESIPMVEDSAGALSWKDALLHFVGLGEVEKVEGGNGKAASGKLKKKN